MKYLKGVLIAFLAIFVLSACESASQSNSNDQTQTGLVGKAAPDFELQDLNGNIVKLSDYKGKKVYLKFWASWCPPCIKSLSEVEELAAKKDKKIEVLTIVAPEFNQEKSVYDFKSWFAQQGYSHIPVLFDNKNADTLRAYQVQAYPTEYLIDSQGKVAKRYIGAVSNKVVEKDISKIK